jgi:hypothetical protein
MRKPSIFALVIPAVFLLAGCVTTGNAKTDLNRALIAATGKAIELEIRGYEDRLNTALSSVGPEDNVAKFKQRIADLKNELEKYKNMRPEDYPAIKTDREAETNFDTLTAFGPVIPAIKKEIAVSVSGTFQPGALLEIDGMTKSGPFYHIVGIKGDDWGVFKAGKHYSLELYLVYKREYFGFISDFYVYIAGFKEI